MVHLIRTALAIWAIGNITSLIGHWQLANTADASPLYNPFNDPRLICCVNEKPPCAPLDDKKSNRACKMHDPNQPGWHGTVITSENIHIWAARPNTGLWTAWALLSFMALACCVYDKLVVNYDPRAILGRPVYDHRNRNGVAIAFAAVLLIASYMFKPAIEKATIVV